MTNAKAFVGVPDRMVCAPDIALGSTGNIVTRGWREQSWQSWSSQRISADKIRELYRQLGVPVIIQGELRPCLSDIPLAAVSPRQAEVAPNYMNTYDIALWQKAECDKLGVQRVVLVSYYPHYWRAAKATEKVGLTVLVPPGLREIYDPNNSQKWARYRLVNRLYELLLARPYSLWKGWI